MSINKFVAGAMKIAIDTSPLKTEHKVRGVGAYTKNLVQALKQESKRAGEQELKIDFVDFRTTHYPLLTTHYDLIHYPYFDLFFLTLPLRKPAKTIVTIHDVIPLVFPKYHPPGIRGKIKFLIQKFSLQGVSTVITDSKNSKKDIVRYLAYPGEKIHIIYLAPGKKFKKLETGNWKLEIREKYNLPEKFILNVGDVNYNKNIPGLLKAFAKLVNSEQWSEVRGKDLITNHRSPITNLVLVGKAFKDESLPETREILQLIKVLKIEDRVLRLGWIEEEELVKIYNLATVYCQPSFYEGFGLPVLEAMACGVPVVAAKTSSLPEICDNAALMVDPNDYNDIARGLEKVIGDTGTREKLIKKGFIQAKNFSWEKTARGVIDVYKKVLKGK